MYGAPFKTLPAQQPQHVSSHAMKLRYWVIPLARVLSLCPRVAGFLEVRALHRLVVVT